MHFLLTDKTINSNSYYSTCSSSMQGISGTQLLVVKLAVYFTVFLKLLSTTSSVISDTFKLRNSTSTGAPFLVVSTPATITCKMHDTVLCMRRRWGGWGVMFEFVCECACWEGSVPTWHDMWLRLFCSCYFNSLCCCVKLYPSLFYYQSTLKN